MSNLSDKIDNTDFSGNVEAQSRLERQIASARQERDSARKAVKDLTKQVDSLGGEVARLADLDSISVNPKVKARKPAKTKKPQARALLMLSDTHWDEVVNPRELVGPDGEPYNAYNRKIAQRRLDRTVEGAITMAHDLLTGWDFDGLTLLLGGDMLSGNLHESPVTNESNAIEQVDEWVDPLCTAISTLADEFKNVNIVTTVGNHGRNTHKWITKGTTRDNFDWMLYRVAARYFRDTKDTRVSWYIPDAVDVYFDIYGHNHCLTHGNQARGGDGITGLLVPVSKMDLKKRARDQKVSGTAASHLWMGHFHTYLTLNSITVNGSLKGIDEYSFQGNFGAEEPKQAFAVITPEHNVTTQMAIYSQDRKAEGW